MATLSSPSRTTHVERGVHSALLKAAVAADDYAFSLALQLATEADVNEVGPNGRTVLGAVIAGESWEEADASNASFKHDKRLHMLKTLLDYGGLSLYSLNAPQDILKGATPLSFVAWLNSPQAVRVLLGERPGVVAVDGMDSRGATPLMYAARDASIEVVQCLLEHGARPDYRDVHSRTAVQFALRHPVILCLCESALKRHRAQEYIRKDNHRHLHHLYPELDQSLATLPILCHTRLAPFTERELLDTNAVLLSAVLSQDIHQLDRLLFPAVSAEHPTSTSSSQYPLLINYPDEQGWSPIHHCVSVSNPSSIVLDMLYRAGADMSLYTLSGHGTPLHCIAYKASASTLPSIRSFIQHLVVDLRAPLSAADNDGDTCIHVAAGHGQSLDVLMALLSCDTTGAVRAMRNARGLTALEVAQDRFKIAFGVSAGQPRSGSSASVRTIKPSTSSSGSTSSLPISGRPSLFAPPKEIDFETLSHGILDHLARVSHEAAGSASNLDIDAAEDLLRQSSRMREDLFSHVRARIQDAIAEIDVVKGRYKQAEGALENLSQVMEVQQGEENEGSWNSEALTRSFIADSVASDTTKVSSAFDPETSSATFVPKGTVMVDIGVSATPMPDPIADVADDDFDDDDPFAGPLSSTNPSTPATRTSFYRSLRSVKSMTDIRQHNTSTSDDRGFFGLISPWSKNLTRKRSKSDLTSSRPTNAKWSAQTVFEESVKSSTARVRAWFKRKVLPEQDEKVSILRALDEEGCPVGREVKYQQLAAPSQSRLGSCSPSEAPSQARTPLPEMRIASVTKDMVGIRKCIDEAERYVASATGSIEQADRLLGDAIEQRKTSLDTVRFIQEHLAEVELELDTPQDPGRELLQFPPVTIPTSPRNSQLVFPRPPTSPSSTLSFSSTLIDESVDDDDLRSLRRLLSKLHVRLEGTISEVEKAVRWLRIVREVMRGIRRRTEL